MTEYKAYFITYAYLHVSAINLSIILYFLWNHKIGNDVLNNCAYCFISKLQVEDKVYEFSTILIICVSNNSSLNIR